MKKNTIQVCDSVRILVPKSLQLEKVKECFKITRNSYFFICNICQGKKPYKIIKQILLEDIVLTNQVKFSQIKVRERNSFFIEFWFIAFNQ